MFIIRDIFQLKFGHFRDARALLEEAKNKNLIPKAESIRVLTDFTGDAYRLIMEEGYKSLADYESSLTGEMAKPEWREWYDKFRQHVDSSHREILRQIQ